MNRAAPDGGMRQETKLTPALAVLAPSGLRPTALDLCGQIQVLVREISKISDTTCGGLGPGICGMSSHDHQEMTEKYMYLETRYGRC